MDLQPYAYVAFFFAFGIVFVAGGFITN